VSWGAILPVGESIVIFTTVVANNKTQHLQSDRTFYLTVYQPESPVRQRVALMVTPTIKPICDKQARLADQHRHNIIKRNTKKRHADGRAMKKPLCSASHHCRPHGHNDAPFPRRKNQYRCHTHSGD
jgi:hypothetical protein